MLRAMATRVREGNKTRMSDEGTAPTNIALKGFGRESTTSSYILKEYISFGFSKEVMHSV